MNPRPYREAADIFLLQNFNAHAIKASGGCGFLHPGDIPHHFFSGNKLFDPAELTTIWEDETGVCAWTLIGPRHHSFDAQVRPDLRGGDFERDVLEHAENCTKELMARYGIEAERLEGDASRCDSDRSRLLLELGWLADMEAKYVLNRRSLQDIPESVVPAGYRIRAVRGIEEAGILAELHAAIFRRSGWTEELYRRYMKSPGYSTDREFVVEAADGSLAAFTVTWHDEVNRTGLFEPVGTHPDHRKKGLGRALLYTVMHRMAEEGLLHALVQNEGSNAASRRLYLACGFEPWQLQDGYVKGIV
jgi:GNAT superfamily N-acetyltransferase